jgi:hypothetical protein
VAQANRHLLINLIKIIIIKYTNFVNIWIIEYIITTVLINIYIHQALIYINLYKNKKPVIKADLKNTCHYVKLW